MLVSAPIAARPGRAGAPGVGVGVGDRLGDLVREDGRDAVQRARAVGPHRLHLARVGAAQRAAHKAVPAHARRRQVGARCPACKLAGPAHDSAHSHLLMGRGCYSACRRTRRDSHGPVLAQSVVWVSKGTQWSEHVYDSSRSWARTACCWGRRRASRSSPRRSPSATPRGWRSGSRAPRHPAAARQPTGSP